MTLDTYLNTIGVLVPVNFMFAIFFNVSQNISLCSISCGAGFANPTWAHKIIPGFWWSSCLSVFRFFTLCFEY